MSWALERRTFILTIIGLVVVAILAVVAIATLYDAPTCNDAKQNQDEEGIDCGGSCAFLCRELVGNPTPTVLFARPLTLANGRVDVLAYVENKNTSAGVRGARYTLELYSADRTLLATHTGAIDLPPDTIVPIFISNLFSGSQEVGQAFLTFDDASLEWFAIEPLAPTLSVENIAITGVDAPRVTAQVTNKTAYPIVKTTLVASVYDSSGNALAASQTVLLSIPPFTSAPAVFTWNMPFAGTPTRIEVDPIITLIP